VVLALPEGLYSRLHDVGWSIEVGPSDLQMDDLPPLRLQFPGPVEHDTDLLLGEASG